MKRERVGSTNVHSIGYDPATKTLEVEFHGGGVYSYRGVSPETHQAIVRAKSVGGALHQHVIGAGVLHKKVG